MRSMVEGRLEGGEPPPSACGCHPPASGRNYFSVIRFTKDSNRP